MHWLRLRGALLPLILVMGLDNLARAGEYCYPQPPRVILTKICYTELVPEQKEQVRTIYKTVLKEEVYLDCQPGCEPVKCIRKVPVQVPVLEKYTTCQIVPKTVRKDVPLAAPCIEPCNCCK